MSQHDRTHYVSLCNHCSDFAPVHLGVPQGSVLGPMLFTMYIKPLSAIIDSHSIIHHSFADDLQLQMSAPPDRISELLHSMQSCMSDVKAWATANMLKLNDSKTELMLVSSKRSKHLHNLPTSITIGNAQIPFKQSVKKYGFTLDCHLTMNAHVSNIVRTCYFELRRLASIRRFLTSTATATLVSAFVLSRIDYCDSLLFGSTHGNAQIPFKQSVKNLNLTLDCHLTMNAHISNIARTCYFELRRLASIRRFLTSPATATLVSAFVLSRIDYCNSLLFGSTHGVTSHLQRIQKYAARVILRLPIIIIIIIVVIFRCYFSGELIALS